MVISSDEKFISVIVPAYNEESSIVQTLRTVFIVPPLKEVIIINDGSTDATARLLVDIQAEIRLKRPEMLKELKIVNKKKNEGKGASIRTAAGMVTGDIVLIQDSDLELDPREYTSLLAPFAERDADVVFGSRFRREGIMRVHRTYHILGNKLLTWLSNFCTGLYVTDMETCYKAFRREIFQSFQLKSDRFGIEPELMARVAKAVHRDRLNFYEVPISYHPRTHSEGKKIKFRDGFTAIASIIYFNFFEN